MRIRGDHSALDVSLLNLNTEDYRMINRILAIQNNYSMLEADVEIYVDCVLVEHA